MAQGDNDLDFKHLFRVIFMQGGQVAIGTAIGAGVLLLVGIVAVFTAPLWLPIVALVYWRKEKKKRTAGGQDVTDLVTRKPASDPPRPADSEA
jgi:hypothetical protein